MQAVFDAVEQVFQAPLHEGQVLFRATLIIKVLECGAGQIQVAQHIAKPCRQALAAFQLAAQHQHGAVGQGGEGGCQARQLLIVAACLRVVRHVGQAATGQAQQQAASGIAQREADMLEQQAVKLLERFVFVVQCRGLHLAQHIRMAANGALTKDHHVAGEDVGAFHGDGDRHRLVGAAQVVAGPHADAFAAVYVHGVVDALAHALGQVVFHHR